jgi:hypothetical protein
MRVIRPIVLFVLLLTFAALAGAWTVASRWDGVFVRGSDGEVWVIQGGVRHRVAPVQPPSEELASIPEGNAVTLLSELSPADPATPADDLQPTAETAGAGQREAPSGVIQVRTQQSDVLLNPPPNEIHAVTVEVWVTRDSHPLLGAEVHFATQDNPQSDVETFPETDADGYTAKTFTSQTPRSSGVLTVCDNGECVNATS